MERNTVVGAAGVTTNGKEDLLPQLAAVEIEMALLGGMILDKNCYERGTTQLLVEDFYYPPHQTMFAAIVRLKKANKPIDVVIVTEALKVANELEGVGGAVYVSTIVDLVPTIEHFNYYVAKIKEDAGKRKLYVFCIETLPSVVVKYSLEQCINLMNKIGIEIRQYLPDGGEYSIKDTIKATLNELRRSKDESHKFPYGLKLIDDFTGGLQAGETTMIAGLSSHGKSAFAVNIINHNMALHKCLVFSYEMSPQVWLKRLAALETGVGVMSMQNGTITNEEIDNVIEPYFHNVIEKHDPIILTPEGNRSIPSLQLSLDKHKPEIVVVDHIQYMSLPSTKAQRAREIEEISQNLHYLAIVSNVVLLIVSQVSYEGKLKDSSGIYQAADKVLYLENEGKKQRNKADSRTWIRIDKFRNGDTLAKTLFEFDPVTMKLSDWFKEKPVEKQEGNLPF